MITATKSVSTIGGDTTAETGSQDFLLSNTQLDKIANTFERSGLGSREDADMCIIPALRTNSMLPSVKDTFDSARASATALRKEFNWSKAEELLKWIYRSSVSDLDRLKAATDLGELYRKALRDGLRRSTREFGYNGIHWMMQEDSAPLESRTLYG